MVHGRTRRRLALLLALAWLLIAKCNPAYPDEIPPPHASLLAAIRQVESGGDDRAVGDGGRSLGPLQTSRAAWQDATRHGRVEWSYDRLVWSWPHCQQVAIWYWGRYDCQSDEQRARIWNGGPRGHLKKSTLPYWNRVKATMKGTSNANRHRRTSAPG